MKTRAAVAWGPGKPLTIEEVELQGPKANEGFDLMERGESIRSVVEY